MRDLLSAGIDAAWLRAYTIHHYLRQHARSQPARHERQTTTATQPLIDPSAVETQWQCVACDVQWVARPDGNSCWVCEKPGVEKLWLQIVQRHA